MRIMLVTDTWRPNVNGVVRVLAQIVEECEALGHRVRVVSPGDGFVSVSMGKIAESPHPDHPPSRLVLGGRRRMERLLREYGPDAVHLATEGPLGWAARRCCLRQGAPHTTAYHTRFPEYFYKWMRMPVAIPYAYLRRFHRHSARVMVPSASVAEVLHARRFTRVSAWPHGVDTRAFHPGFRDTGPSGPAAGMQRPVFLYVGRVAAEKNLRAFLELDLPGSKLVVGDGPARSGLQRDFPDVRFAGTRLGEDLARHYASGDVFVLPSRTETFGLVMLEALASGLPVAAFDAPGPRDVLPGTGAGRVDEDLAAACLACLKLDRGKARTLAEAHSWRSCAERFVSMLAAITRPGQLWAARAGHARHGARTARLP